MRVARIDIHIAIITLCFQDRKAFRSTYISSFHFIIHLNFELELIAVKTQLTCILYELIHALHICILLRTE